jgi:hypothetical protein
LPRTAEAQFCTVATISQAFRKEFDRYTFLTNQESL